MTFHYNNFLGTFSGSGDVDQQIADLDAKVFYKDGSRSMEGTFNASGQIILGPSVIQTNEQVSASTPPTGKLSIYAKTDKELYIKDDAGLETQVSGGTGDVSSSLNFTTNEAIVVVDGTGVKNIKQTVLTVDVNGDIDKSGSSFLHERGGDGNLALGMDALAAITSGGSHNTALGVGAIAGNTGTDDNTVVGYNAGNTALDARNTIIGSEAFSMIQAGANNDNICIGYQCAQELLGSGNIVIGREALKQAFPSTENIAIGRQILEVASNSARNVCVGQFILQNACDVNDCILLGKNVMGISDAPLMEFCIGIGTDALLNNATSNNVGIGHNSLKNVTTGTRNVGIGSSAMGSSGLLINDCTSLGYFSAQMTEVSGITAIGSKTLQSLTTGIANSALGFNSGNLLLTGTDNTLLGYQCAPNILNSKNTAVGSLSMFLAAGSSQGNCVLGQDGLASMTAGNRNIAIGLASGIDLTGGSDNIYLAHAGNASESNQIYIGSNSMQDKITFMDSITIGNASDLTNITTLTSTTINTPNSINISATNQQNTLYGFNAGSSITSATESVFIGESAGSSVTSSGFNTFVGSNAGRDCDSKSNTAVGEGALLLSSSAGNTAVGKSALAACTGGSNIGIGNGAGDELTTGAANICIYDGGVAGESNKIRIGSSGVQDGCFIQGIASVMPAGTTETVLVDTATGELGSVSQAQSSGVILGGILTINADNTKFDISDGQGCIFNPVNAVTTYVSWTGLTEQSTTYVGALTFVSLNSSGVPTFTTVVPTIQQTRDRIYLGLLFHGNSVNITDIGEQNVVVTNPMNQLRDFMLAIGPLNVSGNAPGSNNLLTLSKTVGFIMSNGRNYVNDVNNPHLLSFVAIDTDVSGNFSYSYQDGSFLFAQTSISPADYDDGNGSGSPGTLPSNDWVVDRITVFTAGTLNLNPGQIVYNSSSLAIAAIQSEGFVFPPNQDALLIGYLARRGGATDLTDTGHGIFLGASKFDKVPF